jgi:hypothetical protein
MAIGTQRDQVFLSGIPKLTLGFDMMNLQIA